MEIVTIDETDFYSYSSVESADEWLAADIAADAWRQANSDTKGRSLVTATRWIDAQDWIGEKVDPDQPLAFPRTEIGTPEKVITASIMLANLLVANPFLYEQITSGSGSEETKRLKAGSAEIEYFRNFASFRMKNRMFPANVFDLLKQWLRGGGLLSSGSESYDTCRESKFKHRYGYSQGFV